MPQEIKTRIIEHEAFFNNLAERIKRDGRAVSITFDKQADGRFSVKVLDKYKTVIHPNGKIEIETSDVSECVVLPTEAKEHGGFEFDA